MDTSTTIGGAQPPTHQVLATREATANLIESEMTREDAATSEGNAVDAQNVDIWVPSNPLGEHGAVDAVLTSARSTEQQDQPAAHKASEPPPSKRFSWVSGHQEIFENANKSASYKEVSLRVEAGRESSVAYIAERSRTLRQPARGIPVPRASVPYGTTGELFARIRTTIAEQTSLSSPISAVLTYWVLSTWFIESLPTSPCLLITGSPFEGDVILRTLKAFCCLPLLMAGVNDSSLKGIDWNLSPTLLLSEPNLTKRMAALLGSSTSKGYMVGTAGKYQDYFGPKAIYVGEDLPIHPMPRLGIHINASAMSKVSRGHTRDLSDSVMLSFQNWLINYRLNNLIGVLHSDFDASGLTPETQAIANALGACIVDAPELQEELVSLLAPRAQQQLGERSTSLEALVAEATLRLCHQGKLQIFVREIADEVNRIQASRGETLKFTAEKVGHKLKKVGLHTRRLGSAGNGLLVDRATRVLVHEVASALLGAGFSSEDENVHCPQCDENKGPMQVM